MGIKRVKIKILFPISIHPKIKKERIKAIINWSLDVFISA